MKGTNPRQLVPRSQYESPRSASLRHASAPAESTSKWIVAARGGDRRGGRGLPHCNRRGGLALCHDTIRKSWLIDRKRIAWKERDDGRDAARDRRCPERPDPARCDRARAPRSSRSSGRSRIRQHRHRELSGAWPLVPCSGRDFGIPTASEAGYGFGQLPPRERTRSRGRRGRAGA